MVISSFQSVISSILFLIINFTEFKGALFRNAKGKDPLDSPDRGEKIKKREINTMKLHLHGAQFS